MNSNLEMPKTFAELEAYTARILAERDAAHAEALNELNERHALELESLQCLAGHEFERGLSAARKEVQIVEVGENSPDTLESWIGEKPVMRIQFFADSGDMSVGIWPSCGWEASTDQGGTVLEELLSSLHAANAAIATLQQEIEQLKLK